MAALRIAGGALALLLAGCAGGERTAPAAPVVEAPADPVKPAEPAPPPEPPGVARLRCDDATELRVAFAGDEVRVAGLGAGEQVLLRDAGGETPQQSVFTNEVLRAEFGLGPDGREAHLQELRSQRQLHCVRH